jgi:hypothetical protein
MKSSTGTASASQTSAVAVVGAAPACRSRGERHPAGVDEDPSLRRLVADDGRQHRRRDLVDAADADVVHDQVVERRERRRGSLSRRRGGAPTRRSASSRHATSGHGSPAARSRSAARTQRALLLGERHSASGQSSAYDAPACVITPRSRHRRAGAAIPISRSDSGSTPARWPSLSISIITSWRKPLATIATRRHRSTISVSAQPPRAARRASRRARCRPYLQDVVETGAKNTSRFLQRRHH